MCLSVTRTLLGVLKKPTNRHSNCQCVILTLIDVNDQAPEYTQNGCGDEVQIPEDSQLNAIVCKVLAVDGDESGSDAAIISYVLTGSDSGRSQKTALISYILTGSDVVCKVLVSDEDESGSDAAMISYILTGSDADFFWIEKDIDGFGVIRLNREVDRETKDLYQVTVVASDQGSPPLSVSLSVTIRITDVNDEPPEFSTQTEYRRSFNDEVPSGTEVIPVTATDKDLDPYRTILCNISSTDGSHDYFFVTSDGAVCTVFTQGIVPVRQAGPYVITVQAYNPDRPELVGNSIATISIYVTADLCLVIIDPTDYFSKVEVGNINAGEEVVKVLASSPCGVDGLVYNVIKQTLAPTPLDPPSDSTEFTIDTVTGIIFARSNNPSFGTHFLEIVAFNSSNPDSSTDMGYVTIIIIPNTNSGPAFDSDLYNVYFQAPKLENYVVVDLEHNVTDDDYPMTGVGEIVFTELSETGNSGELTDYFGITVDGEVFLRDNLLELPEALIITLTVQVEDKGLPPLTDVATIIISIEPPASKPPEFIVKCSGVQFVNENTPPPFFLCQVKAEGSSSTITYTVDDAVNFRIDTADGSIFTNREFDYENTEERQFKVLVTATSASDGLSATTSVSVAVRDVNDAAPEFDQKWHKHIK
ncbi:cadherin EGF LAG seven-pass G-type receptor fmi-1-like [Amphiura filiformis]|uniref:cadherin EGF LAG seven-pass G-type receptor fmi-1-like n=1 Tax=Amphiura filiformis TaxID=82378 RepID=UPI003B20BBC7